MKRAGAAYTIADGLVHVVCSTGDDAFNIWDSFVSSQKEEDPHLRAVFTPPANVLLPPLAETINLLGEVVSILHHYAPLRADDFVSGLPPLPAPLAVPPLGAVRFHSAAMSGSLVISRIQNPRSHLYPIISGLPNGTYICTLISSWVGTIEDTHVFRA